MRYFLNVSEIAYGQFDYKIKLNVDDSNVSSPEIVFKGEKIGICKIIVCRIKTIENIIFKAVTDCVEISKKVKIVNTSKFIAQIIKKLTFSKKIQPMKKLFHGYSN